MRGAVRPLHMLHTRMRRRSLLRVSSPSSGTGSWQSLRTTGTTKAMTRACRVTGKEPWNGLQPGIPLAARGAHGGVHREGVQQLCRSVPATRPIFWQPHRGQVSLLLPFPDPTFVRTWQYGQPGAGVRPQGCSPILLPSDPPAPPTPSPCSAQAPAQGMAAAGEGEGPTSPGFPPPCGGDPWCPAGPPCAGLGGCHPCSSAPSVSPGPGARLCRGQR